MEVSLDEQQLRNLRDSLDKVTLEDCVVTLYSLGDKPRPLYGNNSVMLRTLGNNFNPESYQRTYFDEFRGEEAMTEFAEFREALDIYKENPNEQNALDLILEAGDILFQRVVLDVRHKDNIIYPQAKDEMEQAMIFINVELSRSGLAPEKVFELAKIKYGIRSWMGAHGLPRKNKHLERNFCLEYLAQS